VCVAEFNYFYPLFSVAKYPYQFPVKTNHLFTKTYRYRRRSEMPVHTALHHEITQLFASDIIMFTLPVSGLCTNKGVHVSLQTYGKGLWTHYYFGLWPQGIECGVLLSNEEAPIVWEGFAWKLRKALHSIQSTTAVQNQRLATSGEIHNDMKRYFIFLISDF
jgi:hypothetical protein